MVVELREDDLLVRIFQCYGEQHLQYIQTLEQMVKLRVIK